MAAAPSVKRMPSATTEVSKVCSVAVMRVSLRAPLACPSCFQRVPRHQLHGSGNPTSRCREFLPAHITARLVECGLTHRVRRLDTHGAHFTRSDEHFAGDHDARTQRVRRNFGHCCDDSTTAGGKVERRTARHDEVQAAQPARPLGEDSCESRSAYSIARRGKHPRTRAPPQAPAPRQLRCAPAASLAKASSVASVRSIRSGSTPASRPARAVMPRKPSNSWSRSAAGTTPTNWVSPSQRSGLREIQLAEPNETVDSCIERSIADCAERGQQTGSGVMDPQAGQVYEELRRRFRADKQRRWPPDRPGRLSERDSRDPRIGAE